MSSQALSPAARQIEARLGANNESLLDAYARQIAKTKIEALGFPATNYVLTAERKNEVVGDAVFGPKKLDLGTYNEEELYGASGSPIPRFRLAIRTLSDLAKRVSLLDPNSIEYAHQVTLLWADIGKLKEFGGISPSVCEIVAELRTARFQFKGKDTPSSFVKALAAALALVGSTPKFDTALVDRMVEEMESGGFDSLAPDSLRAPNE